MSDPARILPHTGKALFLLRVDELREGAARCTARIPADHALVRDGRAPSMALLEVGAQAAAALAGARSRGREAGGAEALAGRVVGVREACFASASIPAGSELQVEIEELEAAPPLRTYGWRVGELGQGVVSVWTG